MSASVIAAIAAQLGPIDVARAGSMPWCCGTYRGYRYRIEGVVGEDAPLELLRDAELVIDDGFVADVAIARCGTAPGGLLVTLDVLTLDG